MKVLLIKMSSLGDIVHTFPAVVEAKRNIPYLKLTWLVEESFIDLVRLHAQVDNIIPVALRRWRKNLWQSYQSKQLGNFIRQLKNDDFDLIIDAQGLIKSAVLGKLANGKLCGFNKNCARERVASLFYEQHFAVNTSSHIVERNRELLAQALNYSYIENNADFGLNQYIPAKCDDYIMVLHGTTWVSKHYPENYWRIILEFCAQNKIKVKIPWGNQIEHERALRLSSGLLHIEVLPKLSLPELVPILAHSKLCITLDTGLGHLASALKVPCIGLYGPTDPKLIGTYGVNQIHLCANSPFFGMRNKQQICLDKLLPELVITNLVWVLRL